MIKRIIFLLLLGIVAITTLEARQKRYEDKTTLEITGASSGNDSTKADTIVLGRTPAYYNRVYCQVIFDNIVDTNGLGGDFGKEDTIIASLYSVYAENYRLIDAESTVFQGGATAGAAGTLLVWSDLNQDTLFTEQLVLVIYVADTAATMEDDSTMIFPVRYQVVHTFGDR